MKILLCDDHLAFTESIKEFMNRYDDITFIGEAQNISQAMAVVNEHKIDVAFVDLNLGNESGIELIKKIKADSPSTCIIVLTMYNPNMYGIEALKAGAKGYLTKEFSVKKLKDVTDSVLVGNYYFMQDMINLLAETVKNVKLPVVEDILNQNELEVMKLMEKDMTVKEISDMMNCGTDNIYKLQRSIIKKMRFADKHEIIIYRRNKTKI